MIDQRPEREDAANLWGYVDLADAARACLLALVRRAGVEGFEAFVIAADETRVTRPIEALLDRALPHRGAPASAHWLRLGLRHPKGA